MRDEVAVVDERVAALKEAWHLNAVRESRVRRFVLEFLTGSAGALILWVVVLLGRPLLLERKRISQGVWRSVPAVAVPVTCI